MFVVSAHQPFRPVISLSCALLEKTFKRKFKHFLIKRINIRSFFSNVRKITGFRLGEDFRG